MTNALEIFNKRRQIKNFKSEVPKEENIKEILQDEFYDVLQKSWDKEETCLTPCSNTCSFTDSVRTSNYRVNIW